jgi:hypothetical protein
MADTKIDYKDLYECLVKKYDYLNAEHKTARDELRQYKNETTDLRAYIDNTKCMVCEEKDKYIAKLEHQCQEWMNCYIDTLEKATEARTWIKVFETAKDNDRKKDGDK